MRKTERSKHPRLYKAWQGMRQRCDNPNCKDFSDYGGRGIKVCNEWESGPDAFIKWAIDNGYADGLTLDRINVNGDYSPENCRWTTWTVQERNRRILRNNKTGVNGVHIDRGRYRATIYVNNKRVNLGMYGTLEEAAQARKDGERKYWEQTA